MAATNYSKNKQLDFLYGGVSYSPPSNYYLAMSTTSVSPSGSGVTEPLGANYARVLIPNTKSFFTNSVSGCLVNSSTITFPQSSGSWGTIVDLVLFDALTSGCAWAFTTLPTPKVVQDLTVNSFSASAINFGLA